MMGRAPMSPRSATSAVEPTPFRNEAAAHDRLTRLASRSGADAVEELRLRCAGAADPDLALSGAERYADAAGALPADPELLDALVLLCGASPMLAGLLARAPHLLSRAAGGALRGRDEVGLRRVLARAAARLDPDDAPGFHRLLRQLRAREVVRISLRDLRRVRMSDVTGELSALATACLDAAIRFHDRRLRARHGAPAGLEGREPGAGFCALAMGKLGACELNFSSDIDLIYVYGADGTTTGEAPVTHFAYHAKLAELVTESIATPTDDGFVFRVDLNLRPDGRSGPIVNSVRAAELYYQSYGRSWERNALVKARPAAGDVAVGEELLRLLEPFVWRRSLDLEIVAEIQAMKARIDARAGAEGKADLKLGRGGIREVEFFVSALQLLLGRRRTPFSPNGDPAAAVALLQEALATPDPDQALGFLADFAAALPNAEPYFRLLAGEHRLARLLLSLFGSSDFLSKRFLRHPELLDTLLREDTFISVKGAETFRFELEERFEALRRHGDEGSDALLEDELAALRRYKNEEVLRIAVHDIAGALPLPGVAEQLSDLAEVSLQRCLELAETEARAKDRLPRERLCVVAMGKLGGRELGYHSDLDLIFLYRDPPAGIHGEHARLAQRLMSFLQVPLREGYLYKTDTRLRPSGNQGALVTSAGGFARYHTGRGGDAPVRSQLWERQALLRARFVAGDAALFDEVREAVLVPAIWTRPADRTQLAAEIRRMRERIEAEIGKEAVRGPNPKAGRGGLMDIEFAAQFLQLAHGHAHPSVRTPSTPQALKRLREAGLLREQDFQALERGYEFLRRLDLRLRIVHDYTVDHLPQGRGLLQLARRLGYYGDDPSARFAAEYQRVTSAVRTAFDEVVR